MKRPLWRSYPVTQFNLGTLLLSKDGSVEVERSRFRQLEAIDAVLDHTTHVHRPSGPGSFLVVRRAGRIPMVFSYDGGTWKRWVRLYRVGWWRNLLHDVVRTWGIGSPLFLLAAAIGVGTFFRAIYLCFQHETRSVWVLLVLAFFAWAWWPGFPGGRTERL